MHPLNGLYQQFSAPLRLLLGWLFDGIHYSSAQADKISELSRTGTVVYVTRGHSTWLALCFCHVFARMGLPPVSYLGGVRLFWHRPWHGLCQGLRRLAGRSVDKPLPKPIPGLPPGRRAAALARKLLAHQTTFVMLPVPRSRRGLRADWTDYLQVLMAVQRASERPIYLAPHVLITREQGGSGGGGVIDRIFGDSRRPGWLRHWAMLLILRHGVMRMGEPIDLRAYLDAHSQVPLPEGARTMRRTLHHRLDEEERVVAGPRLTVYDKLSRQVLGDPQVRAAIIAEAERSGRSEPLIEVESEAKLKSIASRYDIRIIKIMEHVLFWIFNRIYDGINVDETGLNQVIEASRKGPVVFCPSHKSHVDYLVLSYVMWTHGVAPPHVAAGANLSFFPLGWLFRRCGAFFLRRSFRDDPLYGAVMRAYIYHLMHTGTSTEFFLEGSRSRTGKLLQPKFGLLSMFVDAWRRGARDDVVFVPVSIDYERIIEAKAYSRELGGADKRAEDIGGLLRSTGVLRSRYGRMQVQFGAPLSLRDWAAQGGLVRSEDEAYDGAYRQGVERLGFHILHDIAMVCSVTPQSVVSIALLSHPSRGMAQNVLIERSESVLAFLEAVGARLSPPLARLETRLSAVLEAVHKLVDEKVVLLERAGQSDMEPIFRAAEDGRVVLDYHKNAVMNYFASAALVCRAIVKHGGQGPLVYAGLRDDTHFLAKLFKLEFIYRVDADYTAAFDETLGALALHQLLTFDDTDGITIARPEIIALLAGLLDSFVQAYWVTARTATELRHQVLTDKELVALSLERARRAFLEGAISRPESASRTLMETALAWLVDEHLVQVEAQGKKKQLRLQDNGQDAPLQEFIDRVAPFL
jgi:glycerol-3-phosphate O-acyltransferase